MGRGRLIVLNREEGALDRLGHPRPVRDDAPVARRRIWTAGDGWAAPQTKRVLLITAVYALAFGANMAWLLARQPSIAGSRIGVTVGQAASSGVGRPGRPR